MTRIIRIIYIRFDNSIGKRKNIFLSRKINSLGSSYADT